MSELFDRRVPQWTAVYIGAGWGLVQFIAFMEERYLISPHWTDLCLLTLGLLLPSVVLYTYNHGRPGADRIQRSEKVGIPVNVALAALVVWLVFGNKDLGAMTTEVTVIGADGETIQRDMAKPEFRRRIALFELEMPGASDTVWIDHIASLALGLDLSQDAWLDVRSTPHFVERVREAGYQPTDALPIALKRQISTELNLTHFTHGRVTRESDGYRLSLTLYDAARGRQVSERSFAGSDVLALVDSASLELRRDLGLPAAHLDAVEDLPVSERLSSDPDALRAYARGWTAMIANQWPAAAAHLAEAVEHDPTFAAAATALFQARLYTSDHQGAMEALAIAVNHIYRLPERVQLYLRAGQYQMQQQPDRAIDVLEMAAQLYPDDIEARNALAMLLPQADRERDAIRHLEEVLRIDPGQTDRLLDIGRLHTELGQYDSAVVAYERFIEAAPTRTDGARRIGELEALRGNHDEARRQLERALLLDPANVDVLIASARVAANVGDFDDVRRQLAAAQAAARTPEARYRVAEAEAKLAIWLGQPLAAHGHLQRSLEQAALFAPPMIVAIYRMSALEPLAMADRADEARERLREIAPSITGIFAEVVAVGALSIETGQPQPDAARIEAEAQRVDRFIQAMGWEMLRPNLLNARGYAAELRGDARAAVQAYRQQLELDPSDVSVLIDLGRALRLSGDLAGAARELEHALQRRPADAEARYEMALVHEQAGRPERAVDDLRRALDVWRNAEPAFAPAARARAALDRLLATRSGTTDR